MNIKNFLIKLLDSQLNITHGKKKVIIFGSGKNGLYLKSFFDNTSIKVNFFCDNDVIKQNTLIAGINCISFSQLCKMNKDSVVFVSPKNSHEIVMNLKENGFETIIESSFIHLATFITSSEIAGEFKSFPYLGHFYSLYPNLDEIKQKELSIFNKEKIVLDIDFREEEQIKILNKMVELYTSIPKWDDISMPLGTTPLRYRYGNQSLSQGDAIGLHCMLRIIKPSKLIEVGSGFSSAVILDTNEFYLNNNIELAFIEPYADLLKSILKETDRINLLEKGLQDVPVEFFSKLDAGDVLFIDSTHVSKIGSDVNHLFFEILPRLKPGVYIHLHDIFFPFEYPKEWIYDGLIWNELYLLRAFLQNNSNYSVVFFQNMMEQKHYDIFKKAWPFKLPVHGGSIWLRKEI